MLEDQQLLANVPCSLTRCATDCPTWVLLGRARSGSLHWQRHWAHVLSRSHCHSALEIESSVATQSWGCHLQSPVVPQTCSCHRYMLLQHEKQNYLKGSKPVSVLFLVELMRLDMQTLSENHVRVMPWLLILASQLAQVSAPAVASLTSPVKGSQNAGAPGWEPDWKDWAGHSCSIAGWAGMPVGIAVYTLVCVGTLEYLRSLWELWRGGP